MAGEKESLSNAEKKVIKALLVLGRSSPEDIQKEVGFTRLVSVMNAASWLQMKEIIHMEETLSESVSLVKKSLGDADLPERTALKYLKKMKGVISMEDFNESAPVPRPLRSVAIGWMRKKGWIDIGRAGTDTMVTLTERGRKALSRKGDDEIFLKELSQKGCIDIEDIDKKVLNMLSRRKDYIDIKQKVNRFLVLTEKGVEIGKSGLKIRDQVGQLTPEILMDGRWGQVEFRPYDINAFSPAMYGGKIHPLRRLIDHIRQIFLGMGFEEIWGNYVESAFWNMDALFIPQDHPARDMQDTFYLKEPASVEMPDEDIVHKIRETHESGGDTGSRGWGGEWSRKESERTLLRGHTTINTIKYLSARPDLPIKVFSIEPVFRKESIDKTHLPEFHQVEGIIVEKGSSFRMLLGILGEFYRKMGFEEIRMRPAYFPYTEPSMEIDVRFEGEWLELGGSGIFRPEVVAPFGVEEPVLAWGLGLERLAMLFFKLDDIRQLYISDLDWLKKIPSIH